MFNNPENLPQWYSLSNTRNKKEASGDILVQVGFVATSQSVSGEEELAYALREAILERYSHGRVSRTERVLTAPPTQSVGTMPKRTDAISGDAMENYAYEYELAGDSSSAESDEDEVGEDESDALSVISDERDFTPAPDHPEGEPSAYLENSNQLPDLVVSKEDTARQVEPETADTSKLTGPSSSSVSIEEPTPSVPPKGRKLGFPLFKRTNSTRSTASVGAKSTASSVTPQHAEPFESTESLTGESSTGKKKRFPLPKRRGSTRSDAGHSSADIPPADPKPKKRKRKIRKSKDYEFRTTDVVGVWYALLVFLTLFSGLALTRSVVKLS